MWGVADEEMKQHMTLWNQFCDRHDIRGTRLPVFQCSQSSTVGTKRIGVSKVRSVLRRSETMEALIRRESARLISDWNERKTIYDGLLNIMATEDAGGAIPLYIEKPKQHEGRRQPFDQCQGYRAKYL